MKKKERSWVILQRKSDRAFTEKNDSSCTRVSVMTQGVDGADSVSLPVDREKTDLYKWASVLALITIFYNTLEGLVSVF